MTGCCAPRRLGCHPRRPASLSNLSNNHPRRPAFEPVTYTYKNQRDGLGFVGICLVSGLGALLVSVRDLSQAQQFTEAIQYGFLWAALSFIGAFWVWRSGTWHKPELTIAEDYVMCQSRKGPLLPPTRVEVSTIEQFLLRGRGQNTWLVLDHRPKGSKFRKSVDLKVGSLAAEIMDIVDILVATAARKGISSKGPISGLRNGDRVKMWKLEHPLAEMAST